MRPVNILWVQNDAVFGFDTAARSWPLPIRNLLGPDVDLPLVTEPAGHQFRPAECLTYAHIWLCRTVNQMAQIPANVTFDLALVKFPFEVWGHPDHALGRTIRIPPEELLARRDTACDWIQATIQREWLCEVVIFREHHPILDVTARPEEPLPSQDDDALRVALQQILDQRRAHLLRDCGILRVISWQSELEKSKGDVEALCRCLTGSDPALNHSDGPLRLADYFPELALKAAQNLSWEAIEGHWVHARDVVIASAPPHVKLVILSRLLRGRNFLWTERATFNLQTVGSLWAGGLVSRLGFEDYTPVELAFHMPGMWERVRGETEWPAIWNAVCQEAVRQIERAQELSFDFETTDALSKFRELLLRWTPQQDPKESEEIKTALKVYEGLRLNLSELVREGRDGTPACPCELTAELRKTHFARYPFSINQRQMRNHCSTLVTDLLTNCKCSKVLLEFVGDWPREGWIVFRGGSGLPMEDLELEAQATHNKPTDARKFLDRYFYVLYFTRHGETTDVCVLDVDARNSLTQVTSGLERYVRSLPTETQTIVGYALGLFDFPAYRPHLEIEEGRRLAQMAGEPS